MLMTARPANLVAKTVAAQLPASAGILMHPHPRLGISPGRGINCITKITGFHRLFLELEPSAVKELDA